MPGCLQDAHDLCTGFNPLRLEQTLICELPEERQGVTACNRAGNVAQRGKGPEKFIPCLQRLPGLTVGLRHIGPARNLQPIRKSSRPFSGDAAFMQPRDIV